MVYKILRFFVSLVTLLGVWFITLGLLGSLSQFTRDMRALFYSSRNSLGIEGAVVVGPVNRNDGRSAKEDESIASTGGEKSPMVLPLIEGQITPTPFQPLPAETSDLSTTGEKPVDVIPTPVPSLPTATPRPIGAPDRIMVPKINLDAVVVIIPQLELRLGEDVFTHWQAPDFYAAGWHAGSAFLGEPGNTVLSGHNAIYGGIFDNLANLQQGDEILLYSGHQKYRYLVSQVMVFEEKNASLAQRLDNARWITPSEDERITLVSCWPPRSNSHRIIVVGTPVQ